MAIVKPEWKQKFVPAESILIDFLITHSPEHQVSNRSHG